MQRITPGARITARLAILWAIASLVALVWALARLSVDRTPIPETGSANLRGLWPLWAASASGWGALGALWWWLRRGPRRPFRGSFARWAVLIIGVAGVARFAVIVVHRPALSDDIYRYVFDGRNLAHGINPYLVKPLDRLSGTGALAERPLVAVRDARPSLEGGENWPGEAQVIALVNNPELHTIYLPMSQWVFAAAGSVMRTGWTDPVAGARVFRAVFVLADLAIIVLLLMALAAARRSPWWAALYAWHPLPVVEIAGSGHQESLGIVLLVAAIVLFTKAASKTWRWTGVLGLAVLVKPVVLPVAAVLLKGRPWLIWARSLGVGAVVCVIVAGPLLFSHGAEPVRNLGATGERFTLKWAHFGSVYEPVLHVVERGTPAWTNDDQERLARTVCGGVLALVMLGIWLWQRNIWRASAWMLLAMVLLSPAAHPWYVLWPLALCPLAPSLAVWMASLTLTWGYAVLADPVDWSVPWWVMLAAYVPVYAAIVYELLKRLRRSG
ncbi:MAG: hypothetical protein ACYSTY_04180 [Planctomycetota bacterium]|jgi:hypothetical protein